MNNVDLDFYLVVKADVKTESNYYGKPTVRTCKNKPTLDFNEVPVLVSISIPRALFLRPQLSAKIELPSVDMNQKIDANVQSEIIDAIKQAVGVNVTLISSGE